MRAHPALDLRIGEWRGRTALLHVMLTLQGHTGDPTEVSFLMTWASWAWQECLDPWDQRSRVHRWAGVATAERTAPLVKAPQLPESHIWELRSSSQF